MPTWDTLYKTLLHDHGDGLWKEPHESVVDFFGGLAEPAKQWRILDLGCGTGRHLVFLETLGCQTYGMDISPTGIQYSRKWLQENGLTARVLMADMTSLPYASASFQVIISTYVIHHNTLADIRRTIQEMFRLLTPGGRILVSVPSTRGYRHDKGEPLEPGTVIPDIGQDCGIPHHYFSLEELALEFAAFIIQEVKLNEEMNDDGYLSSHWFLRAEKPTETLI